MALVGYTRVLTPGQSFDPQLDALRKVFRDNQDYRSGAEKLGGVWSIDKTRKNHLCPASTEALRR